MKNNSDVFGFDAQPGILDAYEPDPLDTLDEAAAAVDDILENADTGSDDPSGESQEMAASLLAQHYVYMEKRVRLLTWAFIALAAYIVLKEL